MQGQFVVGIGIVEFVTIEDNLQKIIVRYSKDHEKKRTIMIKLTEGNINNSVNKGSKIAYTGLLKVVWKPIQNGFEFVRNEITGFMVEIVEDNKASLLDFDFKRLYNLNVADWIEGTWRK